MYLLNAPPIDSSIKAVESRKRLDAECTRAAEMAARFCEICARFPRRESEVPSLSRMVIGFEIRTPWGNSARTDR